VELQVEKHAIASGDELLDHAWSVAREQAAADLEAADRAAQHVAQDAGLGGRIDVEGN
jgi:hypothetical protein